MIKWVSFTSKSLETLLITITVCGIYSLNYVYLYMSAPFYYQSEAQAEENAKFIPYGAQDNSMYIASLQ